MAFNKDDLLKVKNKVNSIEDLRNLAIDHKLNFNENDLKRAYDALNSNQEISLDNLDSVSGGKIGLEYTKDGKINGYCPKCGDPITVKQNSIEFEVCPNCWCPVTVKTLMVNVKKFEELRFFFFLHLKRL